MPPVDFVSGLPPPLNWTYDKTSGTGTLSRGSKKLDHARAERQ